MITPEQMAKCGSEEAEQSALFCWSALPEVRVMYPQLVWMFAIPNGGFRDIVTAGKLKAGGVKAGVWDIFLPVPKAVNNKTYHGLFIEMKVKPNGLTPQQKKFQDALDANYAFAVAYNWEEARNYLQKYLGLPNAN